MQETCHESGTIFLDFYLHSVILGKNNTNNNIKVIDIVTDMLYNGNNKARRLKMTVTLNPFQIFVIIVAIFVNYNAFDHLDRDTKNSEWFVLICIEATLFLAYLGAKSI